MTQADLAYAAESSTRHLSCLETGKAQPSREMIARLAEYLEIRCATRTRFSWRQASRRRFRSARSRP